MATSIDMACTRAAQAFDDVPLAGPIWVPDLLRSISRELEADRELIVAVADDESHLGAPRLHGELSRTTGQLEAFADWAADEYARIDLHDQADPDATPAPTPDLQRISIPIGPVAVFAASNFPLAFGVIGGDSASALAAGNPVIARAHPLQLLTARTAAAAIARALESAGAPDAWFQLVDDPERSAGETLVRHPAIRAVGFTGSYAGGTALASIAAQRAEPIPVYAEMGSINPLVITDGTLLSRSEDLARSLAASITQGAGQFCTKPGLIVIPNNEHGAAFADRLAALLSDVEPQQMLSPSMAQAFLAGFLQRASLSEVMALLEPSINDLGHVGPGLLAMEANDLSEDHPCTEELFGPAAVIVHTDRLTEIVERLPGSLTFTVHSLEEERAERIRLLRSAGRRAGRIIHNGFPTGVAVRPAMHHGGPFPASNHAWATSVGLSAAERFRRPLSVQSWPSTLVEDLIEQ